MLVNGQSCLDFSCNGLRYMPVEEFMDKDLWCIYPIKVAVKFGFVFPVHTGALSHRNNMRFIIFLSIMVLTLVSCSKDDSGQQSQAFDLSVFSGNGASYGRALATDDDGNIIFVGFSNSTNLSLDFSHKSDRGEERKKTDYDVIIGKYYIAEKRLVSAVIGGSKDDKAYAVAVGAGSRIYVTGKTTSDDFPQTIEQQKAGQLTNIFISELSPDLSRIVNSRVIAGNNHDYVRDIEVDAEGSVYLTGSTASDDFPVTNNSFMTTLPEQGGGPWDIGMSGFVMKLSADLSEIRAATYVGGDGGDDHLYGMALAPDGDVYIIGNTNSASFPTTVEAFDPEYNGSVDIILARFDRNLRQLKASTYFGAEHYQYGRDIAINESGEVYAVGQVHDRKAANPIYSGAAQNIYQGGLNEILLIRFDASLSAVTAITYLGGTNDEYVTAVSVRENDVFVTGYTASLLFPPLTGNSSGIARGTYDVFTVSLNRDLSELKNFFRIGGKNNEFAYDMFPDSNNNLLVIGNSNSDIYTANPSGANNNMELLLMSIPLEGVLPNASYSRFRFAEIKTEINLP